MIFFRNRRKFFDIIDFPIIITLEIFLLKSRLKCTFDNDFLANSANFRQPPQKSVRKTGPYMYHF